MNSLYLTISSVTENLFDGEAISATIPTTTGEITILPDHEPLISTLTKGSIIVRINKDAEPKRIHIESGVLEISGTRATILV